MDDQIRRLVDIVGQLRAPDGCPWDRKQNHRSLISGMLDEVYEFFEAVDKNSDKMMREELGDILLQIVFHSQIATEEKRFDIDDVAQEICEKLIRRHPHVFGDTKVKNIDDVLVKWEEIKQQEKKAERKSAIDGIPPSLPALFRAEKMQHRAARVGFDWDNITPVLDKVEEEFAEFREAIENNDHDHATEEMGDIIFALINVARHKNISAEDALRRTIDKFDKRFRYVEKCLKDEGKEMKESSLEEMDVFWEKAKKCSDIN